jgi:exosortase A-associated hydrolase 1
MRRLLTFGCEGAALAATLDDAAGEAGLLVVTGGTQTRIGSHRLFERLTLALAASGTPCLRFDRRGVGDSEGADPDWRGSGPDVAAAAAAFRRECPGVRRIVGFGLCDGASALALHGPASGLDALILVNPWFVEAEAGAPPPAAIRDHYRRRLLTLSGWKRLLTGAVSFRKLASGLARAVSARPATLAAEIARSLEASGRPLQLILALRDATAVAARAEWGSSAFAGLRARSPEPVVIDSDSHTFSRPGDAEALEAAVRKALVRLSGGG